jgi:hypothetical protein
MNGGGFPARMPILDWKNYNTWCIKMRVTFSMQDVLDFVIDGVQEVEKMASDAHKQAFLETEKMDYKALFLIHQCVDMENFERISAAFSAKEDWDIVAKSYAGLDKLKKIMLQIMRMKCELLQMNDQENVIEYLRL